MSKTKEKIFLLVADFIAINLAWSLHYYIRVESGFLELYTSVEFLVPMFVVYLFWLLIFGFLGLYNSWYAKSRFDELAQVFKAVTLGSIILFFLIFVDDTNSEVRTTNRSIIVLYWLLMVFLTEVGRASIHSIQRKLLLKGIGLQDTLIIGWSKKARALYDSLKKYPALGYRVVGFVSTNGESDEQEYDGVKVLSGIKNLPQIIIGQQIKEILIAVESTEHEKLIEVISRCEPFRVGLKIMPDLYDIVTGQARTNQIYGFPLIDIMPQLMTTWERVLKRILDFSTAIIILILFLPFWITFAIAIKIDSKGTILYRQKRVGKNGKIFTVMKFRSMYSDAEKHSGPKWAEKNDPRVTRVGLFLRKSHLDEVPQFINILKGDMSLIGPRPERPYFVEKLGEELPLYLRRLKVRPGITGWAQVKHKYDESLEDVKIKLQYDLHYIENISLKMDLKIILNTIYLMIAGKGH